MTISYPLSLPSSRFRSISLRAVDAVGVAESPFSFQPDVQHFGGQRWEADVEIPSPQRGDLYDEDAEEWVAFLLSLKGRYGTFLMGDPAGATPRGTWAGTPVVDGAHAVGESTLNLKTLTTGATIKKGDYVQTGTGSTAHLYKALNDVTVDGTGLAALDIWPNLRTTLADDDAIVSTSALGLWRLASNVRSWDIGLAKIYGIRFVAVEAF